MKRIDLGPKCAAAATAIEAWMADEHDEPSTLVAVVLVAEMQTLDGEVWLQRASASGTEGFNDLTVWARDGMLQHGITGFGSDEEDE